MLFGRIPANDKSDTNHITPLEAACALERVNMQEPPRVAAVYFCQIRLAQPRLLDHPDGMLSVLLSLLPESEGIVRAEYDLFGTKHSGNAGDYDFVGWSRRIVKKMAKIIARFVLAFTLAKGSFDPAS